MSEHTPTPWKYNILDDGNFGISAGWTDIATVYNRDDDPGDEANAEFIVRACNSHDDLLAALKSVIERFPGGGRVTCRACDTTFREDDPLSHPHGCPVAAAIAKTELPA